MKKLAVFLLILFFTSVLYSTENPYLNFLLNIKSEKYYETINGKMLYDSLAEFQDLGKLYVETRTKVTKRNAHLNDIKFFSFIGFVAYNRNAAATKEAMLSDFIQVYYTNRDNLLSVLNELPFLIPSSCYYIGKHFGFEGKFTNDKKPFMNENKAHFLKKLSKDNAEKCLSIISGL